jgi:hypothetical protein
MLSIPAIRGLHKNDRAELAAGSSHAWPCTEVKHLTSRGDLTLMW